VEIGGGFRIPDVLAQAGATLVEVGTTNRTRLGDYERAVAEQGARLLMRVHQSNFRTVGFVEDVEIEALCGLGVPVIDDIGSGALASMPETAEEPSVRRSLLAGAAVVCFSGDKLLGGPQAGIIVGRGDCVERIRRHPLARALRIGRLPLAALTATLALHRDPARALRTIPALAMLALAPEETRRRAAWLAERTGGEVITSVARAGGGSLPLLELRGHAVALAPAGRSPQALAAALRAAEPPLITRIAAGRVVVDPRTLWQGELETAAALIVGVLGERRPS
jgi:L-seryl-tRNA(Ser) seleniumtransferase